MSDFVVFYGNMEKVGQVKKVKMNVVMERTDTWWSDREWGGWDDYRNRKEGQLKGSEKGTNAYGNGKLGQFQRWQGVKRLRWMRWWFGIHVGDCRGTLVCWGMIAALQDVTSYAIQGVWGRESCLRGTPSTLPHLCVFLTWRNRNDSLNSIQLI